MNVLGPQSGSQGRAWGAARISAACFGLAGIDSPEDEAQVARWVREQAITATFTVVNDSELILAGGTPEGWGVALVAGTGSVCLGRTREGRTVRVGGWGPILGDEGSGYQIAVSALRRVTQTADGRAHASALLAAVLRHWSLAEPGALIRHVRLCHRDRGVATVCSTWPPGDACAEHVATADNSRVTSDRGAEARGDQASSPCPGSPGGPAGGAAVGGEVGPVNFVNDPPVGGVVLARRLLQPPNPVR